MTVSSLDELFIQSGNIEVTADATYFDGTVDFSGAVNAKSAKFTAVTVGTVNVSEMDTEIQALAGHAGSLQVQLNEMRVRFADLYPIRYPLRALTEQDRPRVTFSTEIPFYTPRGLSAFAMFDGVYGENAIPIYDGPTEGGWITEVDSRNDRTSLTIDGVVTFGDFCYLDLSQDTSSAIITKFQLYAGKDVFPTVYRIIGSNDEQEWTSLFRETERRYEATYRHGTADGAYTSLTALTKRDKHYRYVGVLIEQHTHPDRAFVQELLLYGG
jgi:hypothetical protein